MTVKRNDADDNKPNADDDYPKEGEKNAVWRDI